ncbi:MAG: cytochrome c [Candidatus Thiodiazotropha taylori]|nr:cytochrome c [Candidatus Thiodiazotropha taylori]MCG8079826.1 cytochrome c [Candidatus Thiodiazotropha taylori]MCW4328591.1 cytochrome c [Candidatus Thiodiazotropha taylori]
MKTIHLLVFFLLTSALAGCSDQKPATAESNSDLASTFPTTLSERWYTQKQVARGQDLYQTYCAECHKPDASGTTEWRTLDVNGKLPPPPLNGTAHTWHHPLSVLRRTVRLGGVPLGGSMPGFSDKLSAEQIDEILAWIQTHWSDEIYRIWYERDTQANTRLESIKKG